MGLAFVLAIIARATAVNGGALSVATSAPDLNTALKVPMARPVALTADPIHRDLEPLSMHLRTCGRPPRICEPFLQICEPFLRICVQETHTYPTGLLDTQAPIIPPRLLADQVNPHCLAQPPLLEVVEALHLRCTHGDMSGKDSPFPTQGLHPRCLVHMDSLPLDLTLRIRFRSLRVRGLLLICLGRSHSQANQWHSLQPQKASPAASMVISPSLPSMS